MESKEPRVIYGLFDSRFLPPSIRYVGYTGTGMNRRLVEHKHEAKQGKQSHRHKWIRSISIENLGMMVLEYLNDDADWQAAEREWIARLQGLNLTNATAGGEGLVNPSQEVRDAISKTLRESGVSKGNQHRKGIMHSADIRAKISASLRASEKHRAASEAKKGQDVYSKLTDEQKAVMRAKVSAAKKGVKRAPFSEEARRNMAKGHIGLKHTEEAKAKISAANRARTDFRCGFTMPDEAKKAIAEKKRGTKRITNGIENKYLMANEQIQDGWHFGWIKLSKGA